MMKKFKPILVTLLVTLINLGVAMKISAAESLKSFYTDESPYYQRLIHSGMLLRFRLSTSECESVARAELLTKAALANKVESSINSYPFTKLTSKEATKSLSIWPANYGLSTNELCWFSAKATALALDSSHYTIKLQLKDGQTLYLNAETDELIPAKRLKKAIETWSTPGALGATVVESGGVLFKLWEPEAERVDLELTGEAVRPMKSPTTIQNVHTLYLPHARAGSEYVYHFVKDGQYEELEVGNNELMSSAKIDPMAKNIVYEAKGGSINGHLNPRAVVTQASRYQWQHDRVLLTQSKRAYDNWIIYQLWPLTFNPKKVNGRYQGGTFSDVAEKVEYLADLGINAVEFLPIHESRFHASWGYALDSLTLIEKNYGTPDEFRSLVDKMHSKGLKVVLDVVINHVNNSLLREPLSKTRQRSKIYSGNTEWGPKPDFDNVMVRKWIADSLLNLVRDYHIDGLRFDMIEHVYKGSPAGYKFIGELGTLLKLQNPRLYSSAEQLPDNVWATYPLSDGGLGFDSQWNDKFKNFFELKFDFYRQNNRHLDLAPILGSLAGFSNHSAGHGEYHFGGAQRTVNYLGSHDVVGNKNPFLRIISDFESYESVGHNYFTRVRPLEIPLKSERERKFRLIHNEFNHRASLTSYGLLFTKPGAALFFQGEELASDINIENEWSYINARENNSVPTIDVDIDRYVGSHRVQWEYLETSDEPLLSFLAPSEKELFQRYHRFFKHMIHFKKEHPEINQSDAIDIRTLAPGIFSYRLERGPNELFVIINYGDDAKDLWVPFPGTATDWWHETTTLADKRYTSGKERYQNVVSNLGGRSNHVRIAGASISIFTKKSTALINKTLYFRSNLNRWGAERSYELIRASEGGELYSSVVEVKKPGMVEFKIADQDWSIELGSSKNGLLGPSLLESNQGFLSYTPGRPNAKIDLPVGSYQFIFDLRNFKYSFIKL